MERGKGRNTYEFSDGISLVVKRYIGKKGDTTLIAWLIHPMGCRGFRQTWSLSVKGKRVLASTSASAGLRARFMFGPVTRDRKN